MEERNAELVKQGMKKMVGAETYVSLDRIRELEFVSPGVNIQEKAETRAVYACTLVWMLRISGNAF